MSAVQFVLTVMGIACAGVGAFLYHDGHDHELAGKLGGAIGVASLGLAMFIKDQQVRDENYNCVVLRRAGDCPDPDQSLLGALFGWVWDIMKGGLVEWPLLLAATVVGFLLAQATARKPKEPRSFFDTPGA